VVPFIDVHLPAIGPLQIHLFGVLVAIGILVGSHYTHRRAAELGLLRDDTQSMIGTILVAASSWRTYSTSWLTSSRRGPSRSGRY